MFNVKEMLYSRSGDKKRSLRIVEEDGTEISKEYEFKDIPEEFKLLENLHNDAIFARRKFNDLRYDSAIVIDYNQLPIVVKEKIIEEIKSDEHN